MPAPLASSAVVHRVYLLRTAPENSQSRAFEEEVAAGVLAGSCQRLAPMTRIAGHARSWLVEADGELCRDGVFAVATTATAQRSLAGNDRARLLAELRDPLDLTLKRLSVLTAAILALQEISSHATRRPLSTQADIERCERWIAHPILQYLTGRGAQRSVVSPWERFMSDYSEQLQRLQRAWEQEVKPCVEGIPPKHPLRPLFDPLALVSVERDWQEILTEYRWRLATLSRECGRVAGEIGVVGVLASLALVPVAGALGALFLIPVLLAGLAYYGGYGAARVSSPASRKTRSQPQQHASVAGAPPLSTVVSRLSTGPVRVLAGPRMAAADVASAVALWLALLERSHNGDPLAQVVLSDHDTPSEGSRVVIGGPLVRVPLHGSREAARATCELTDEGGAGWHFRAAGEMVASARDNESVGCLATAVGRDDLLFLCGTRDTGTVIATERLTSWLNDGAPEWSWTLVSQPA